MIKKFLKKLFDTTDFVKFVNNEYKLNSKYKIGKVQVSNKVATLELLPKNNQKIFIEHEKLNGAYSDDIVLVQILFNPKGKTKAKVIQILESNKAEILCYVKNNIYYSVKENVRIDCKASKAQNGDIVILKEKKITKIFGNISDPTVDEKISLYLYNKSYRIDNFKLDTESVATNSENRIDLTDLPFSTIDPVGAKDYDDAIYFDEKSSCLFVAIADVSAYVNQDTILDNEAKKRAFSIYFPHKVMPMLPFELSNDLCSLVPNQKRLAYTFKIKLDIKNLKVISSEVFEATIESKDRYTYEQIDEILKTNDKNNRHVKLYDIMKKFRYQRLKNGYDFRNDEIRLILDDDENLENIKIETSSPSHSLVEECMLLTNQEAAKKLKNIGIFRVHDEPTQAKIKKLLDEVNILGIKAKLKKDVHTTIVSIQQKAINIGLENEVDELIIQSQQQACYSSIKKEHFGLGFSDYSHFTSPIRRYSDLVLHRILKTGVIPDDIEEICEDISRQEREIAFLVWDFEDRKYARYFSNHVDEVFMATIVDAINYIVKTEDGARIYLDNYRGEKLFSKVKIKIVSSDIVLKKIIGVIVV